VGGQLHAPAALLPRIEPRYALDRRLGGPQSRSGRHEEAITKHSVVWVRERTIPTERPPLVGEVRANFLRIKGATWSAWRIPTAVISVFLTGTATFYFKWLLSCSHEAEWIPFQTHCFSESLVAPGIKPDLWICSQELWPLDHRGGPWRSCYYYYLI
jgi:hypothetical protein